MMVQTMKIDKARAAVKLFYLLYKLGMLSEKRYIKLVNYLTMRSLRDQMKERANDQSSK